jgi:pimeloyl-ACP methyl ester carboxylesterase
VLRAVKQEYEAIDLTPDELRREGGYGNLGSKPLIVIRRGKTANPPSEADLGWQSLQQSLLTLSTDSELVVAENSGHVVPYDEPEVVAAAVRKLLAKLKAE